MHVQLDRRRKTYDEVPKMSRAIRDIQGHPGILSGGERFGDKLNRPPVRACGARMGQHHHACSRVLTALVLPAEISASRRAERKPTGTETHSFKFCGYSPCSTEHRILESLSPVFDIRLDRPLLFPHWDGETGSWHGGYGYPDQL